MANVNPFSPIGPTVSISATTSTASVALPATAVSKATANAGTIGGASVLRIVNAGTALAFVRWGTGAQAAVVTDMPILPSSTAFFSMPYAADTVAAITGTSTATIYITAGEGQG